MIVQACLNGARPHDFHPRLPVSVEALAQDAAACVAAGAAELHIHPRDRNGAESLGAVDVVITAVRQACPGTLIGVSTGAWIEGDAARTRAAIAAWRDLPDHASVNLSEADAPAVMQILRDKGIGIEAGLASVDDAERLVGLALHDRVLRTLVELEEQDVSEALGIADAIMAVLTRNGLRRPVLLHGFDATVWPMVGQARQRRWSVRIGLEDGRSMPDGAMARDNADLVKAAVAMVSQTTP